MSTTTTTTAAAAAGEGAVPDAPGGGRIQVGRVGAASPPPPQPAEAAEAAEGRAAEAAEDEPQRRGGGPLEFMDLLYYTTPTPSSFPATHWLFKDTHGVRFASKASFHHQRSSK